MKKIIVLLFLATLTAVASGCNVETDSGRDINTSESNEKNENTIIGKWGIGGASQNWIDSTSELFTSLPISGEGWDFKSDGTFEYFIAVQNNPKSLANGITRYKGNYQIDGDKISCSNVTMSWASQSTYGQPDDLSHNFEPFDNFGITYKWNGDGSLGISKAGFTGSSDASYTTYSRI